MLRNGLLIAAATFALFETALRVAGLTQPVLYEADPAAGYRLKPNQHVRYLGNAIAVNQWGARDPRPFDTRVAGQRRLLVLGDSVTWGGIRERQENLFTSVLERELAGVEVVNAGVNGYSVSQMAALYQAHLNGLDPDWVLVCAIPRDFTRPPEVRLTGRGIAFPVERPRLATPVAFAMGRMLAQQRFGWSWAVPPPQALPTEPDLTEEDCIARNIEAYMALDEALGGRATLALSPTLEPGPGKAVRTALARAGIEFVELQEQVGTDRVLFVDGVHLSMEGHARVGAALAEAMRGPIATPRIVVRREEDIYTYTPPNNGSGPLWSFGCAISLRLDDTLLVSEMETGVDVPPLSNTRWRLRKRADDGWTAPAEASEYRQREPTILAATSDTTFFLYVNDSAEPPGARYGRCVPHLLKFRLGEPGPPEPIMPEWTGTPKFTDHSYRGFASDRARRELLMLNIDAGTSVQNWCRLTEAGEALGHGQIVFPIRSCYPHVALRDGAGYVLAIGDIVEPVEEWRKFKFEQTQREWDYVFRILYFTWSPDLSAQGFAEPIEIANVDDTAGHIMNQDLWIGPENEALIMYTECEVQSPLMRDRFFPGKSTVNSLHLAVVKDGAVTARRTLIEGTPERAPGHARFHETPDGAVYAVMCLTGAQPGNYLMRVYPEDSIAEPIPIPLGRPFGSFLLPTVRAGNLPSNTIDIVGACAPDTISYAEILLE